VSGSSAISNEAGWVFPSLKLRGKRPISGSQFVKDQDEARRKALEKFEARLVQ